MLLPRLLTLLLLLLLLLLRPRSPPLLLLLPLLRHGARPKAVLGFPSPVWCTPEGRADLLLQLLLLLLLPPLLLLLLPFLCCTPTRSLARRRTLTRSAMHCCALLHAAASSGLLRATLTHADGRYRFSVRAATPYRMLWRATAPAAVSWRVPLLRLPRCKCCVAVVTCTVAALFPRLPAAVALLFPVDTVS